MKTICVFVIIFTLLVVYGGQVRDKLIAPRRSAAETECFKRFDVRMGEAYLSQMDRCLADARGKP